MTAKFQLIDIRIKSFESSIISFVGVPGGSVVRNPSAMQETRVGSLGQEDSLEKEMVTHSSILV